MTMIADMSTAGKNSLGLVRLLAAIAVVLSHGYVVTYGAHAMEPLESLTGYPLGAHAVHVFFTISGLLVAASFERRPSIIAFGTARFFRIYPGLLIATLLIFMYTASAFSTAHWSEILSGSFTGYFERILIGLAGSGAIPGVFETLPYSGGVNVPLWTLKYEVLSYIGLGVIMFLVVHTRLFNPVQAAFAIVFVSAIWLMQGKAYDAANFIDHIARFSFAFWAGVLAWHFRTSIPVNLTILTGLAGLTALSVYAALNFVPHILMLFSGYLALYAGRFRYTVVSEFTDRNDLSYGTYIYGWPIQQIILLRFPDLHPLVNGLIALMIILPLAYLSWRFVEKPALKLKDKYIPEIVRERPPFASTR